MTTIDSPWLTLSALLAWAGTALLVASLLPMVREPRLAAALGGLDRMVRWHHRLGTLGYALVLGHPLALAAAHWPASPRAAWEAIAPWGQPATVGLGWAALGLLMVGLASTFAMRLPYRRWRSLHRLLAPGVIGGVAHAGLLSGRVVTAAVLGALALAALGWRLLRVDLGMAASPYRVERVAMRAAGVIEATLAPQAAPLPVHPGQFVLAAFGEGPHYHGCDEFHPFTVSGVGAGGALSVAVKALGPCTRRLQALEPGVQLRLQGPFGDFLDDRDAAPQLWVAGGIGVTPFVAALRERPVRRPTTLVYLFRDRRDAAFLEELQALDAADEGFELLAAGADERLAPLEGMLARVPGLADRRVHACGPPAMIDALRGRLARHGVAAGAIRAERFDFR